MAQKGNNQNDILSDEDSDFAKKLVDRMFQLLVEQGFLPAKGDQKKNDKG